MYRGFGDTTKTYFISLKGGLEVFVNQGKATCTNDTILYSYPSSTQASSCTHKLTSSSLTVNASQCPNNTSVDTCVANGTHCIWREVICFESIYWLKVKSISSSATTWYSTTDKLKPGDYRNDIDI